MRGRSYTPSPPRGYGRRGRSPPRGRYGRGDEPTSLLVRNLRHDCRPEDLRRPFSQFGPVKDIYLPRDYYTNEPRGFGFVQYVDPADAADAKYEMDGRNFQGRELTVVFAEENRKKPTEMRARERGRGRVYDRSPRYSRTPRYSRSPSPRYGRAPSRSHDYYSPPPKRKYSRSISPRERMYSRERSHSLRRSRSRIPEKLRSPYGSGSCSQSPGRGDSPVRARSPSYSRNRSRSPSYSRSRSPFAGGDGSSH